LGRQYIVAVLPEEPRKGGGDVFVEIESGHLLDLALPGAYC
jgi:hypothetical protein